MRFKPPLDLVNCEGLPAYNCGRGVYSAHALWHIIAVAHAFTERRWPRRDGFLFASALIITKEGSSAPAVTESVGGSLPIANLKALLKDLLSDILKENPSLLQQPGEMQRGELAAFMGGARCINRLCPGVVSEAKWHGRRVLWVHRSPERGTEYAVGVPLGAVVPIALLSFSSPPPLSLSNGSAGAALGEIPDGGVVEGLGLPVMWRPVTPVLARRWRDH